MHYCRKKRNNTDTNTSLIPHIQLLGWLQSAALQVQKLEEEQLVQILIGKMASIGYKI